MHGGVAYKQDENNTVAMESKKFPPILQKKKVFSFLIQQWILLYCHCMVVYHTALLPRGCTFYIFFHKTAAKSASLSTLWSLRNVSLRATLPRCLKSSWPVERGRVQLLSGRRSPQFRRALLLLEVYLYSNQIMHFSEILLEWQITGNCGVQTLCPLLPCIIIL